MSASFVLRAARCAVAAASIAYAGVALSAATIVIVNGDPAGVGFNDPTAAAPVGGNAGTTLGQQRLNAFQAAANQWGATLTSVPTIRVFATFEALSCTATSAVLGSAGTTEIWAFAAGVPQINTWYHYALANKLTGVTIDPTTPEIVARFNVNLGQPGCLTGSPFYLGLDNNHGPLIDLVTVLLHEFGHGLGFSALTSGSTGSRQGPPFLPAAWEAFMFDNTAGKTWLAMTNAERQASAINPRKLVWTGASVTAGAPSVLFAGTPQLAVSGPAAVAGTYEVGPASFGPLLGSPGVSGDIMPYVTQPGQSGPGCDPFNATNTIAARNNIMVIDRGVCGFTVKVKNAQNAGARGVLIADNVAGSPPSGLGGADPTIVIPSVRITLADGNTIKAALQFRSRSRSGVIGTLGVNASQLAGADTLGRVLLFTPNPFQGGSSVSHWDTIATRNLLMEPAINADLTHNVVPPDDLTFPLLQDIGW